MRTFKVITSLLFLLSIVTLTQAQGNDTSFIGAWDITPQTNDPRCCYPQGPFIVLDQTDDSSDSSDSSSDSDQMYNLINGFWNESTACAQYGFSGGPIADFLNSPRTWNFTAMPFEDYPMNLDVVGSGDTLQLIITVNGAVCYSKLQRDTSITFVGNFTFELTTDQYHCCIPEYINIDENGNMTGFWQSNQDCQLQGLSGQPIVVMTKPYVHANYVFFATTYPGRSSSSVAFTLTTWSPTHLRFTMDNQNYANHYEFCGGTFVQSKSTLITK